MITEHPRPWWFKLALRWFPTRCREIPEAVNPGRTVLRQVALWLRNCYLQQFSGSEDHRWMHSHQWRWTLTIGLWGSYVERRLGELPVVRNAPYLYWMDHRVVHHVQYPTPGHTSLFIGFWRNDDLKHYYPTLSQLPLSGSSIADSLTAEEEHSRRQRVFWSDHIKKMVARI